MYNILSSGPACASCIYRPQQARRGRRVEPGAGQQPLQERDGGQGVLQGRGRGEVTVFYILVYKHHFKIDQDIGYTHYSVSRRERDDGERPIVIYLI